MPIIKSERDVSICYEFFGDPSNPCVIFIAGITGQLISWPDSIIQGLVNAGFYVVTFDNRDVGLSSYYDHLDTPPLSAAIAAIKQGKMFNPPYTLNDMAQDIVILMDQLTVTKAHIVGISMGGQIAQIFAIEHPDRILSLTCIATSSGDPELPPPNPEVMDFFFNSHNDSNDFDSLEVICNFNYLRSVLSLSLLWSVIPIFGILAPFIIQNLLHQSAKAYGQYALFIGLGFLLGNLLNNILIRKFEHFKIILVSLFLVIVISIVQSIFMFANMLSIVTVMLPSVLIMFFIGIVFPLLFGGAAVAEKRLVGVASALIGCLICLGAFVITFIISLFETHPAVTLSLSFLILSVISLVLQLFNKNS